MISICVAEYLTVSNGYKISIPYRYPACALLLTTTTKQQQHKDLFVCAILIVADICCFFKALRPLLDNLFMFPCLELLCKPKHNATGACNKTLNQVKIYRCRFPEFKKNERVSVHASRAAADENNPDSVHCSGGCR